MSLIGDFIQYVRRPAFRSERDPFSGLTLIKLVLLQLALSFILLILMVVILQFINMPEPEPSEEFQDAVQARNIGLIVFFGPLIEEAVCRLWLGFRRGVMIGFPAFLLLMGYLFLEVLVPGRHGPILMMCVAAFIIYAVSIWRNGPNEWHMALLDRYFPYVLWSQAVLFGLIHISNYSPGDLNPLILLLILPQTVAGLLFGYTRMRYGFWPGFLLHGTYNGAILYLLMSAGG